MINQTNEKTVFKLDKTDILPLCIWLAVFALTWTFMHGADHFLKLTQQELGKYFQVKWILIAHITAGGGSLILGLPQFWKKLRIQKPKLHRTVGLLYLLAVLTSSLSALVLALTTAEQVNWAYAFSLQVWVGVWISATSIAYYAVSIRKYDLHQQWMVRSYLVTLAFMVSGLALKLPMIQSLGSFADVSPSLFWAGWAIPLYGYQVILAAKRKMRGSFSDRRNLHTRNGLDNHQSSDPGIKVPGSAILKG